jgi:hypothetical protein
MSFNTLGFLESVNPASADGQGRTVAEVLARARAGEQQGEAAEAAEAEAKRAAALEQAETLALQNRALGDPMGGISRAQAVATEARDEIAELEAKLAKAHKKLAGAQGNLEFFAARMQVAQDSARRSAGADLLAPAKAAHREYVQTSQAAQAAAQAGTPWRARRPFASRGAAVRSEHCIHCINQGVSDEDSYLLHSDPELNVPVTSPAQAAQAVQAAAPSREQQAEVGRLLRLGYSRESAELAVHPYRSGDAVR